MRRAASVALVVLAACDESPHATVSRKVVVVRAPDAAASPALSLGTAQLTVNADTVDVGWNDMTLHLPSRDCGAITAALATDHATSVALSADRDLPYAQLVALIDCIKPQITNISISVAR